jgi:NaMN:DMB phosphoribosyltransferase
MLGIAFLFAVTGLAWFALAMERHWRQVRDTPPRSTKAITVLRWMGALALAAAFGLCLRTDHASMAVLVYVMMLAVAAALVALTLAWRPQWLRPLIALVR